ncbi:hypothetical protein [Streptomyces sp. NRRL B-24484]|uniref:hypothetical protein n=1 Tax=Streptomyces sp. NRRL B-24484 TaxID=1463833 RepID=UPI0004C04145|nr:hypothetical protein [Streptomyces sp. NRRL B-24484]
MVTEVFDEELRLQLAQAREALEQASAEGDDDGAQAYAGRVTALLRIADRHGIALPRTAGDDQGEG